MMGGLYTRVYSKYIRVSDRRLKFHCRKTNVDFHQKRQKPQKSQGGQLIGVAWDRVPSPAAQLTLAQKDDWRWNF